MEIKIIFRVNRTSAEKSVIFRNLVGFHSSKYTCNRLVMVGVRELLVTCLPCPRQAKLEAGNQSEISPPAASSCPTNITGHG